MKRFFHLSAFGLLIFKLLLFLSIIFLGLLIFNITTPGFYYCLSTLFIISSGLLFLHKKNLFSEQNKTIIQILLETSVENILIQFSGGLESPFIFLLILDLFFGAYILSKKRLIFVTFYVAFFYSLFSTLAYLNYLPHFLYIAEKIVPSYEVYFYYVVYMRVFLILMMGYLASQLSGRIVSQKQRIEQMKDLTNNILYQIEAGLISVDRKDRIIYVNKAASELFDIKTEQLQNIRWQDFIINSENILNSDFYQKAYSQDGCEVIVSTMKYGHRSMKVYFSHFIDENIKGKTIIFRDLTIYKEMEELKAEKEKMQTIGDLSAALAHEIKNPLASICGSLEVLRETKSFKEMANEKLVDVVFNETERLERILSEFLTFSGGFHLKLQDSDIKNIINEVILLLKNHNSRDSNIELNFKVEENISYQALLDSDHLKQVIYNLILNGIQAIKSSGSVTVDLKNNDSSYLIEVADTGIGISENHNKDIFKPFFSTKNKGIGLGLNVCKKIADKHKWKLSYKAGNISGTIFSLEIPKN